MVPQQSLPYNDTPVTRTHEFGFNTICRTVNCVIPPQNQLVIKKDTLKSFMAFDITSHKPIFKVVIGSQTVVPNKV